MSVTVVLVIELHFKFISDDSDKTLTLFAGHMAKGGGFDVVLVCPAKKAFVKQSLVTEASSGTELSWPVKVIPITTDCFKTTR